VRLSGYRHTGSGTKTGSTLHLQEMAHQPFRIVIAVVARHLIVFMTCMKVGRALIHCVCVVVDACVQDSCVVAALTYWIQSTWEHHHNTQPKGVR